MVRIGTSYPPHHVRTRSAMRKHKQGAAALLLLLLDVSPLASALQLLALGLVH